jgi:HK97 family phage portal protein
VERSSLKLSERLGLAWKMATGSLLQTLWGGRGGSGWQLLLPGARYDYEVEAGELYANAVVALCLKWLGDRFPKPPIRVSRIGTDGKYVPLPKSPMVDLWNKPNAYMTRRTLETAVGMSLVVDGNAYIHKRRTKAGQLHDLWWLPHDRTWPEWDADPESPFVKEYKVQTDFGDRYLPPEDVIHLRVGLDPQNVRKGYAPLKACLREVCSTNEESGYVATILRNMGVPGLAIVPDDPMLQPSKEDAERIKEKFREAFTGDNRGDAVVMAGKYKVDQVGFSPEQLALDKLPAMAIAKVASACGVEPMSVGLPDPNKTFSNKEAADRSSWASVSAMQDIIAEGLRYGLLPEFGYDPQRFAVEYDYTGVAELNEAADGIAQRAALLVEKGILTPNEGRELMGFEPLGDEGADMLGGALPEPPQPPPGQPGDVPPANPVKAWRYY